MNLYLTPKGLSNNIIYTQLYIPLTYLSKEEPNIVIFSHSAFKGYTDDKNVKIEYYNSDIEKLKFLLNNNRRINNIYTRSVFEFYLLYFLRLILFSNYKIRYDYRGLISEESFLRNKSNFRRNILLIFERFAYRKADTLSTVSDKFKLYLNNLNNDNKEICVTPCCTNVVQFKEKSNEDIIKFLYVGSLGKWQNFDEMLKCYRNISNKLENTSLTIITNETSKAKLKCKSIGLEANIFSVNNKEINNIIKDFDFGFLLRDDILLNNVASPVKFLEYISNGVIPIISNGVGDYSELVVKEDIGILVDRALDVPKDKLLNIINNPNIYLKLYTISQNYTWDKYYLNFKM